MLIKTWQRWKNHTLAKLLQGFRKQVTWLTLLGGNNLDHVYVKGDMSFEIKNQLSFFSDHTDQLYIDAPCKAESVKSDIFGKIYVIYVPKVFVQ